MIEHGHEIVLITGRLYKEKVETTGAKFHPLPEEIDPGDREIYDCYPQMKELTGLAQLKYTPKHVFLDTCLSPYVLSALLPALASIQYMF